jgi:hypothetical protein
MTPRYGRDSRYRRTPTVTRADHTGRMLPVDDARPRPPTGGRFTHTVDGHDRLDHLGQRYYGKPHQWWAIADANPEFTSPLALLGLDPVTAVRITLPGTLPPLWAVLDVLRERAGVEDLVYEAAFDPDGPPSAIVVTYNRATVDADTLVGTVRAHYPAAARLLPLGSAVDRVGQPVVVPPEPGP